MLRVYVCLSFHSLHVLILFVHFKVANISKVIVFRFQKYPVKFIGNVTLGNNLSDAKGISGFFDLVVKQTKPIFQRPLNVYTWKLSYIIFMVFATGHGALIWLIFNSN